MAFGGVERRWLVLDDTGAVVTARRTGAHTASIVAMCELAEDLAGGGDLEQLRAELAAGRMVEQPPGIEEAEDAALASNACSALHRALPHRTSLTASAPRRLRRASLGEASSPLSSAIRGAAGAVVDEFVREGQPRPRRIPGPPLTPTLAAREGGFGGFPFGGDPEGLLRGLREFASSRRSRCRSSSASSSRR